MPTRRSAEGLLDLGLAEDVLDLDGVEHALHGGAELLGHLVDDGVGADLDALGLGGAARVGEGADVEADDDRVGGRGEHHVGLVDAAGGGADDVDAHLLLRNLGELVHERLERTRHIGLEDDVELLDDAFLRLGEDLVERELAGAAAGDRLGLQAVGALAGELAGAAVVLDDLDPLPRLADAVEPEHLDGIARAGGLDALAGVAEHRPHLAPLGAGDDRVADVERAALDQERDDGAAARDRGGTR